MRSLPTRRVSMLAAMAILLGVCAAPACAVSAAGQVLNLRNWYLQLPTGRDGSPDAVYQPRLNDFTRMPWFGVVDGRVRFRTPVGGATTSGSDYPRTELRESSPNASWSTKGHNTMSLRTRITAVPPHRPRVAVAQIFQKSDDYVMILYDRSRGGLVWTKDSKPQAKIASLGLGKDVDLRLAASRGRLRIYVNGVKKVDQASKRSGLYFKAGSYCQSNTRYDRPSSFCETQVSRLVVTH